LSFFTELKRRNVIRVGIAYTIVAWVVAQVAEFAFENFGAPDWVLKSVVVMLLLGLPVVLVFAWAFELTPEGIKRERQVDRSKSITSETGRRLDRAIIVVLLIALGWFAWDKFAGPAPEPAATASVAPVADDQEAEPRVPQRSAEKSVAVLPFVAMSNGPDDEYFADGLTEEILNSLAQLPELLVTARTSAFAFKGQELPIQEIAATLGVRHIVEGSVRRSGERLRVTAQLIRADDGFHLWSENYDSTSADTITVQENIAEKIATALDVVLDERKREAMRQAGLRSIEAFTLYQKGLDYYDRAHGEMDQFEALQQANVYFEQVMDRVPEFGPVYAAHSDLYVHLLTDALTGEAPAGITEETLADAYRSVLADYDAATRYAPVGRQRYLAELDLAYLSGNWRGLAGRIERALADPGCSGANWTPTVASLMGYAAEYYELAAAILACDPLRSLSWYNAARAKLWAGEPEEALRLAREGSDTAPGLWLTMTLVQTMLANGLHDEADQEIENRMSDAGFAISNHILVAAHRGDRDRLVPLLETYDAEYTRRFFDTLVYAWSGRRDDVNRVAAEMDEHYFGPIVLWGTAHWCQCGSPWDLSATPNFAAKLEEANIAWPPQSPLSFPLKDW
jgi:TolB-like protein